MNKLLLIHFNMQIYHKQNNVIDIMFSCTAVQKVQLPMFLNKVDFCDCLYLYIGDFLLLILSKSEFFSSITNITFWKIWKQNGLI